jgi:hypothetical protein
MTLTEKKDFEKHYKDGKSYSKKQFKKKFPVKTKLAKKEKEKFVKENFAILGFIKSLVDKEFKKADEFMQKEVDNRIKKRISDTIKD